MSAGLPRERSERDRCQTADKGSARTEKSTSTTKANHCPRSATMILTVRRNALRSQINLSFSANFLYILHFTIFQSNSKKCIKMCQHKNSASCETLFFLRAFLNKNFRYGLLKNNKQREKNPEAVTLRVLAWIIYKSEIIWSLFIIKHKELIYRHIKRICNVKQSVK